MFSLSSLQMFPLGAYWRRKSLLLLARNEHRWLGGMPASDVSASVLPASPDPSLSNGSSRSGPLREEGQAEDYQAGQR